MTHGLGRRPAPDPRDERYPARAILPRTVTRVSRHWWADGAWLDQGSTGTCVGHAWAHWVEDGPTTHAGTVDPYAVYDEATLVDEWQGNERDRGFGTSVRAGAKALQARGLVGEYRWASNADEVAAALLEVGPVVVGTNWYSSMFAPEGRDGVVRIAGNVVGGHAYLLDGANVDRGYVRAKNSWSRSWGTRGFFRLSLEDLDRLIREDGEACLAVEVR